MQLPDTEFRLRLERKINEALDEGTKQLRLGYASDYPQYQDRVGFLRALEQMLDFCAEVEKEINVPQRGA